MTISNNELTLRKSDLIKSVGTLYRAIAAQGVISVNPVINFNDELDSFSVAIEQKDDGYLVTCTVNGKRSECIDGRLFEPTTPIGKILIIGSGSKESSALDDNAYVLGFFA